LGEAGDLPYRIENADGRGPVVLLVDHASNRIPARWHDLGLSEAARSAHIAWDPGALPVARAMSRILDAPVVAGTVSRLVLDLNRPLGSATMMPATSETTPIPGNRDLDEAERGLRVATIWEPYHRAVDEVVRGQVARCGDGVAVVAVHTFTPVYRGVARTLHAGILFDRDTRLGLGVLERLSADPTLVCRANEPYSPADEVYFTLSRHAEARGLANVMIEIRNDLLAREGDQEAWAERLADAIARTLADMDEDRRRTGRVG
jgi:predicted N-formylglutamate amidohydrolase